MTIPCRVISDEWPPLRQLHIIYSFQRCLKQHMRRDLFTFPGFAVCLGLVVRSCGGREAGFGQVGCASYSWAGCLIDRPSNAASVHQKRNTSASSMTATKLPQARFLIPVVPMKPIQSSNKHRQRRSLASLTWSWASAMTHISMVFNHWDKGNDALKVLFKWSKLQGVLSCGWLKQVEMIVSAGLKGNCT